MSWHTILWLLVTLWRLRMQPNPELPLQVPAELLKAAEALNVAATKWGLVADGLLSWHLPAAFVVGLIVGAMLYSMFQRRAP
jgi:hypothetical protein